MFQREGIMSKYDEVKNPCKRKIPIDEHWFDANTGKDKCDETEPDWSGKCDVCGQAPIIPVSGMCGPCTFGEAKTANGNW